jgi:hypothetical protein
LQGDSQGVAPKPWRGGQRVAGIEKGGAYERIKEETTGCLVTRLKAQSRYYRR